MAITITAQEVKDFCKTGLPDSVIQLYIDSTTSKIGECVETSYDEATATIILLNVIAHLLCGKDGKVSSVSAPNGASKSFALSQTRSGLRSSSYGETVYDLDTKGCWQKIFTTSFMLKSIGNKGVK